VSNVPDEMLYTVEHEYVLKTDAGDIVQVGITDYAQGELGDVVFVSLPKVGETFDTHEPFGTIEAVKAVSELYSPVAGTVTEVNDGLDNDPAIVNRDPYGTGWMVKFRVTDADELHGLLDASAYRKHIGE
jgi:glycine cleavage system H protein